MEYEHIPVSTRPPFSAILPVPCSNASSKLKEDPSKDTPLNLCVSIDLFTPKNASDPPGALKGSQEARPASLSNEFVVVDPLG